MGLTYEFIIYNLLITDIYELLLPLPTDFQTFVTKPHFALLAYSLFYIPLVSLTYHTLFGDCSFTDQTFLFDV